MKYSKYFTIQNIIISIAVLLLAILTGGLIYYIIKKNKKLNSSL